MGEKAKNPSKAEQLLLCLQKAYVQYEADFSALKRKKGGLGGILLGFLNGDSLSHDPMHGQFTQQISTLTEALAQELSGLTDASPWADAAADLLLRPKDGKGSDAAGWTEIAAELLIEPLLPYLSKGRLEQALREYQAAYRPMLPNQAKLLKAMEAERERR